VLRLWRKTSLTLLKQNRMTSELSNFATRLRERIPPEGRVTRGPDLEPPIKAWDSCNSSLRSDEAFNALALELFALQLVHNDAYRRISEARGVTPRTVSHWSQIPAVPAAAFKEMELTCLPQDERTHVFHSSGTTEQRPSRHFHHAESLALYESSLWTWFERHLLNDLKSEIVNLRLAILAPPPAEAPHSSLVHMFETVRRKLGSAADTFAGCVNEGGSWLIDFGSVSRAMEGSRRDGKPMLLLGTAFSFVHLLDLLTQQNLRFRLPPGSRVMETGGYKGRSRTLSKPDLHALITESLGVPPSHVVCEYGMSELSSQAYERILERTAVASPHPVPLPKERENCRRVVSDADTLGNAERRTSLLPLLRVRAEQSGNLGPIARSFHFPPWARAQIISPETGREVADGETGLIRVFDLANVFSVMAIQTEDLGIRRGDGFELIGRAELAEPRGCSLMVV
jgi:hypothetical protein